MLLDEIGAYLEAQAVGTLGADLFLSALPDQPDTAAAVLETGGFEPDLAAAVDNPTFQIICRSADYGAARAKAQAAYVALHGLTETMLSGRRYLLIRAMQSPTYIGADQNGRHLISTNYAAMVDR